MAGFEPATFCSQSRHATKLRYIPLISSMIIRKEVLIVKKSNIEKEKEQTKKQHFIYCNIKFLLLVY